MVSVKAWFLTAIAVAGASALKVPQRYDVPGTYIIEFKDDVTTTADSFIAELKSKERISLTRRYEYTSPLYKGFSFSFDDKSRLDTELPKIASMPHVKKISPVRRIPMPSFKSPPANFAHDGGARLGRRNWTEDGEVWHKITGVDRLRNEGFTGKGIKVAVVDTGIDYKHPALGGCFGKGCLVSFGANYIGPGDPYNDVDSHGTLVSGIIAAQKNPFNFTGIAPGVTLGHFRVQGLPRPTDYPDLPTSPNEILIKAYLDAFHAGSHIITGSIGGMNGWEEEPWAVVISRIMSHGVICLLAAGNQGNNGLFLPTFGFGDPRLLTVGASTNHEYPALLNEAVYTSAQGKGNFGWKQYSEFSNGTYPLIAITHNSTGVQDACKPLPATVDFSGKTVFLSLSTCEAQTQVKNLGDRKAANILFYNTEDSVSPPNTFRPEPSGPIKGIGLVPNSFGQKILKALDTKSPVTITITNSTFATKILHVDKNPRFGGTISIWSSWGPSYSLQVSPTVLAPGYELLTTSLLNLGGYEVTGGTSFATPYLAGAVALILEARGKTSPAEMAAILSSTATQLPYFDGSKIHSFLGPTMKQGAGLVNVHRAAYTTSIISTNGINFNDTKNLQKSKFSIWNKGRKPVTYKIGHVPVPAVYALNGNSSIPALQRQLQTDPAHATLSFSSSSVTLLPGKKATVEVSATPPKGLKESRIPVYNGFITVNATDGSYVLPYLGVAGSMRDAMVLDKSLHDVNILKKSRDGEVVKEGDELLLRPQNVTGQISNDEPSFNTLLSMGSRRVEYNALAENGTDLGHIYHGEPKTSARDQGRMGIPFIGKLENGKFLPEGICQLRIRALRIFGDEKNEKDWDVIFTPKFKIRYRSGKTPSPPATKEK
ncbi:hypothetical protein LOZ12_001105 [Ophidiomyces ophidiicola]|uniref:Uncharacterized protein n=1 Tax=Ophidiomyces ophidiicola TaxID=1387563 RepID=A0ACB8V5C7_9EURO|nr:hypothetical protein LOZ64_004603 [Ophidiomyces ophidiicola]KAI1943428.1 hypothetical protein LOZ62_004334 [Ophidiomyces ophidiicola]KAI1968452.1 hypothetical protein LOZ59_000307 [Ophidiomyces ophidiicola]KAI1970275.1 hypothetical protein LOZ56_003837 [Ophidiomyces ophidiicola]KAI2012699.1 hypothetical protein LOZ50_000159 [Ophidiomyces ophidiicola]